ncbi:hypothetical protein BJV77DRAFT_1007658 [Russula vinacea]|nr:hypothetical protein BJV77DRAFT_1007658 [Russula vinacea]
MILKSNTDLDSKRTMAEIRNYYFRCFASIVLTSSRFRSRPCTILGLVLEGTDGPWLTWQRPTCRPGVVLHCRLSDTKYGIDSNPQ